MVGIIRGLFGSHSQDTGKTIPKSENDLKQINDLGQKIKDLQAKTDQIDQDRKDIGKNITAINDTKGKAADANGLGLKR